METETPSSRRRPRPWLLACSASRLWRWSPTGCGRTPSAAVPAARRRSRGERRGQAGDGVIRPDDLDVRLEALQAKRPDTGDVERNPFRFRPPPAPPPPPKETFVPPPRAAAAAATADDSADSLEVHGNGGGTWHQARRADGLQGIHVFGTRGGNDRRPLQAGPDSDRDGRHGIPQRHRPHDHSQRRGECSTSDQRGK